MDVVPLYEWEGYWRRKGKTHLKTFTYIITITIKSFITSITTFIAIHCKFSFLYFTLKNLTGDFESSLKSHKTFFFSSSLWRTKEKKKRMKRGINLGFVNTIYEEEDYVDHSSSFSSSSSSISPSPQPRINLSSSSMELESRVLKW